MPLAVAVMVAQAPSPVDAVMPFAVAVGAWVLWSEARGTALARRLCER